MPPSYIQAFALEDNPFAPTRPLPKVGNAAVMTNLDRKPLPIDVEPELKQLYCADAGPFCEHLKTFEETIEESGYDPSTGARGMNSFVFLIQGPQGTGKSTLANLLVHTLKQCTIAEQKDWCVERPWAPNVEFLSPEKQSDSIDACAEVLVKKTGPGDYCCVILDNMRADCIASALTLFDKIAADRFIFLFLTSSDLAVLDRPQQNDRHDIIVLATSALTPEQAVSFLRHRVCLYRRAGVTDLTGYEMFPFTESDLRNAVRYRALEGTGIITLRQLGVILAERLRITRRSLAPTFDIGNIAMNEIGQYIVSLLPAIPVIIKRVTVAENG